MLQNVGMLLAKRARLNPKREAVVDVESARRVTYEELNAGANRVANALVSIGVGPGDRVAVLLRNRMEFVELYFAVAKIGAVLVLLNWRLLPDELEFMLRDSGSSVLVYDSDFDAAAAALQGQGRNLDVRRWIRVGDAGSCPKFAEDHHSLLQQESDEEPRIGVTGDDLLFIMYTSGTTGLPKGAMLAHKAMIWASITWNMTVDLRVRDRFQVFLPLFHVGGLLPLTLVFHRGGTVVMHQSFDAASVVETIEREKITTTLAVPTMLQFMVPLLERGDHDYASLRWIVVGGGPVPVPLLQRYTRLGIAVIQDYGLTEACGPATILSPEEAVAKAGSCGKPCFHTDVRVVDDAGRDVDPGQMGEVIVGGDHLMTGYWGRPEATAEALRDGWLYTGDLGILDEDGYLSIRGRKTDMIISGGENIYPAEIENVLLGHPKVKDVALIAQPSAVWCESPAAIVVPEVGATLEAEEIVAYCRANVAGYKVPRVVEFVDEIPRTSTGKIQKHLLRERFPGQAPE